MLFITRNDRVIQRRYLRPAEIDFVGLITDIIGRFIRTTSEDRKAHV